MSTRTTWRRQSSAEHEGEAVLTVDDDVVAIETMSGRLALTLDTFRWLVLTAGPALLSEHDPRLTINKEATCPTPSPSPTTGS